jgi:16S rRNA (guanine966-N2)-methyltransferase
MDSKLQIISGVYRGRKLNLPVDARPTQNLARIALFNMLEGIIVDPYAPMVVWDAFAGSGSLGIECLSRYPQSQVVFTDVAYKSIQTVRSNLAALTVGGRAKTFQGDAIASIQQWGAMSDLIFVDPPYPMAHLGVAFVKRLQKVVRKGTIVVWEQEMINFTSPNVDKWRILRDKQYGRARFLILQKI